MVGRSSAESEAVEHAAVDELPAGTTLMNGAYTIESFLNAGGFGMTYIAHDSLNRRVVIKECFPGAFCRRKDSDVQPRSRGHLAELNSVVRLFVNEAKALAKLDHPGIVGVHQVFEENNTAYMALDYVEGRDLLDILVDEDLTLGPAEVEGILRRLLDAVGNIHEAGMLHRDISPDNILLDDDLNPVLIDFGAAREQATKKTRVMSALRVVKDGYSPQEFYIGGSEQGAFSDLYSLGACFYHLLSNEIPPDGQVRIAALASGDEDPYRPLVGRIEGFDENFLRAIDKSLAVLPKDRVRSAAQWLQIMDGEKISPQRVTQLEIQKAADQDAAINLPDAVQDIAHNETEADAPVAEVVSFPDAPHGGGSGAAPRPQTAPVPADRQTPVMAKIIASAVAVGAIGIAVVTQTDLFRGSDDSLGAGATTATAQSSPAPAAPAITNNGADTAPVSPAAEDVAAVEETEDAPLVAADTSAPFAFEPEPAADPVPETAFAEEAEGDAESTELAAIPAEDALPAATPAEDAELAPVIDPEAILATSSWTVVLPFGMSFDAGRERVLSVNGIAVETREDFDRAIQDAVTPGEAPTVALSIVTGRDEGDSVTQDVDVPVVHRSGFTNGLEFETRHDGSSWITRVRALPEGSTLEMAVDDRILAFLNTNELVDGIDTLPNIFERAMAGEEGTLMLAVERDGENWAIAVPSEMLRAGAGG